MFESSSSKFPHHKKELQRVHPKDLTRLLKNQRMASPSCTSHVYDSLDLKFIHLLRQRLKSLTLCRASAQTKKELRVRNKKTHPEE